MTLDILSQLLTISSQLLLLLSQLLVVLSQLSNFLLITYSPPNKKMTLASASDRLVIVATSCVIVATFVIIVATIQFSPNSHSISFTKKRPFAKALGCQIKTFNQTVFRRRTFLVIVATIIHIVATLLVIVATIQFSPNSHSISFTKKRPFAKALGCQIKTFNQTVFRRRTFLVIVATFIHIIATYLTIVATSCGIIATLLVIVATIQFSPNTTFFSKQKEASRKCERLLN